MAVPVRPALVRPTTTTATANTNSAAATAAITRARPGSTGTTVRGGETCAAALRDCSRADRRGALFGAVPGPAGRDARAGSAARAAQAGRLDRDPFGFEGLQAAELDEPAVHDHLRR